MATQQSASSSGSSNTVVQIIGEHNVVTLAGAAALQLRSYRGTIFATAPVEQKRAGEAGYTKTGRRETRILYPYNRDSLPLQGRTELLDALRNWLDATAARSIQALIGGGGRGKTRLAVELAAEARTKGWTAGFARREELDVFRRAGCRTTWDAPSLVVVDYAAAKSSEIAAWLRSLVHEAEGPDAKPLRVLLLERLGGKGVAWWREVFGGAGPEGEAVFDMLAPHAPLTVGPLAGPEERHAVFAAAFREASGVEPPSRHPALDHALDRASLGGDPLFLAMFGLTAARQGLKAAKALTADRIALDLAQQELERIGRVWQAHGLPVGKDRPLHVHLAAVAALCEGLDEAAAHATIAREAAALHQTIAQGSESVRAALATALPDVSGGIAAMQPDILAEAGMILAWRPLPDGGTETVRRAAAAAGQRAAVSRSVIRACQDFLIRGEPGPLRWLQALRADLPDVETLLALTNGMPTATVELRETALELTETVVTIARQSPGGLSAGLLADSLHNLSNRLADLGRREAALQAIEEAVTIYRSLAAARPDAVLPELARSLSNLSVRLANLGRSEAALQASEEAATIHRRLAATQPDAFLPDLADSLNNLSNHLADLARREAALQAIEEAVTVNRSLAVAQPDAFLPGLASSLNNLSSRLSNLGRSEAALQAVEEAVAVRRSLAAARPDAFLPDLADSLNNLSNRLADLGRREAALQAIEEAVTILRGLAAARPDAFLPVLAGSLNNLSVQLANHGRREAALQTSEEVVRIYRSVAAARPDAFLPDLAMSLTSLSSHLSGLGRREAALQAIEEAVMIRRSLAAARPDAFLPSLALSLNNLSIYLAGLGRREPALQAIEEAVTIRRSLAAARPQAFLPDLAMSLNNLSNRLADLGRREAALQTSEEAVPIYRSLAAGRPDAFLSHLASSLNNLSSHLSNFGRREAALQTIEEAVTIHRRLAASRPDAFLPNVASSLNNLSRRLSNLGRREAALQAIEEAVTIRRRLAATTPDAFLPDLASSLGFRGRVMRDTDPVAATHSFAEAIDAIRVPFLTVPVAFAELTGALCRDYMEACEAANVEPNIALLAPIMTVFEKLSGTEGENGRAG